MEDLNHNTIYKIRWLILFIKCANAATLAICQSGFGQINDILVKTFNIFPWQVDWLILNQSVIFITLGIPIICLANYFGFRKTALASLSLPCLGMSCIIIGIYIEDGYPLMVVGQILNGFSFIFGTALIPALPALWFPSNEVATAVGLQYVATGVGECIGAIVTPLIVNINQSESVVRLRLMLFFMPVCIVCNVFFILGYFFVLEKPPVPPSLAQKKAEYVNQSEDVDFLQSMKQFGMLVKKLICNVNYVIVITVAGAICTPLRNYTILLSSMLQDRFASKKNLDVDSGSLVMASWVIYTLASLASGVVITKSEKYRATVIGSAFTMALACLLIFVGLLVKIFALVCVGVLLLGVGTGFAYTSVFELMVEVSYPVPPIVINSGRVVSIGAFRLLYPSITRVLLSHYGAASAAAFSTIVVMIALLTISGVRMKFKRWEANQSTETSLLLSN